MSNKLKIFRAFSVIPQTLYYSFPNIALFEILYKLFIFTFLTPLIKVILFLFTRAGGYPAIINEQIPEFLTSLLGILMLLILAVISAAAIYYEFAVIISFLQPGLLKESVPFTYGLKAGFHMLTSLKSPSSIGFIVYGLGLVPYLNLGISSSLLPSLNIPSFISGEVVKYKGGTTIIAIVLVFLFLLFVRMSFVLPYMTLQSFTFKDSFVQSFRATRRNALRVALVLFCTFFFWGVLWLGATLLSYKLDAPAYMVTPTGLLTSALELLSTPLVLAAMLSCYSQLVAVPNKVDYKIIEKIDLWLASMKIRGKRNLLKFGNFVKNRILVVLKKISPFWLKKRPYFLILFLGIAVSGVMVALHTTFPTPFPEPPLIIGHRGSTEGVENTLEAIEKGIDQGSDYIEIDILLSGDNVPMVIHDSTLFRLSGKRITVHGNDAAVLTNVPLRQGDYMGYLSTLDELCKAVKGRTSLLIELKTHDRETASVVDETMKVVQANGMEDSVLLMSAEYPLLQELNEKYPHTPKGYVVLGKMGRISTHAIRLIPADFIGFEDSAVTRSMISACHKANKKIFVWTVNEESRMRELIFMDVDGIITDYPAYASKLITTPKEKTDEDNGFNELQ